MISPEIKLTSEQIEFIQQWDAKHNPWSTEYVLPVIEEKRGKYFVKPHKYKWISVEDAVPQKAGRYEVYRAKADKVHYEKWNNTGWSFNNNTITHWREIVKPNL